MPMRRKLGVLVAILAILTLSLGITAYAYTQEEICSFTGPATGISGENYVANGIPELDAYGVPEPNFLNYGDLVNAKDNKDGTYTFEGKTYRIASDWGQHCLTGYSDTGCCTASGVMPTVKHTVSGPTYMLGKYCLIKGQSMLNGKSGTPQKYDGIYKFEDTGGTAVQYGTARTMNVPVVDIYCESDQAARAVTDVGTIVADILILEEVK